MTKEHAEFVDGYGKQLRVRPGLVGHFQQADGPAADHRTADEGYGCHHQYVHRVAVLRQGVGDIAVVARVVHGGVHEAVHEHRAGGLVHFVFYRIAVGRNFDDDVDVAGHIAAGVDAVKIHNGSRAKEG